MMKEVQEQQQQQGTTDSAIVIPRTMKCIVYGDQPGIVDEAIRPTPKMGTGGDQVVVQVHAVGLNPVDAKDVMGDKLPRSLPFLRSFARRTMVQKNIIGFDFAGKIVSIDNTSSGVYQIGDHVFGTMPPFHGSLAEYIVAPMDQISHMPKCYSKPQQGESTTKRMTKYPLSFIQASSMPLVW